MAALHQIAALFRPYRHAVISCGSVAQSGSTSATRRLHVLSATSPWI